MPAVDIADRLMHSIALRRRAVVGRRAYLSTRLALSRINDHQQCTRTRRQTYTQHSPIIHNSHCSTHSLLGSLHTYSMTAFCFGRRVCRLSVPRYISRTTLDRYARNFVTFTRNRGRRARIWRQVLHRK